MAAISSYVSIRSSYLVVFETLPYCKASWTFHSICILGQSPDICRAIFFEKANNTLCSLWINTTTSFNFFERNSIAKNLLSILLNFEYISVSEKSSYVPIFMNFKYEIKYVSNILSTEMQRTIQKTKISVFYN